VAAPEFANFPITSYKVEYAAVASDIPIVNTTWLSFTGNSATVTAANIGIPLNEIYSEILFSQYYFIRSSVGSPMEIWLCH
jgi:hypothetical protein